MQINNLERPYTVVRELFTELPKICGEKVADTVMTVRTNCLAAESPQTSERTRVLIKSADDKSKRLRLLEDLEKSPLLDRTQKDWLAKRLRNMRTGIAGEKDAATTSIRTTGSGHARRHP